MTNTFRMGDIIESSEGSLMRYESDMADEKFFS